METRDRQLQHIFRCSTGCSSDESLIDIDIQDGAVVTVTPHSPEGLSSSKSGSDQNAASLDANGRLIAPSLCHPHVHLDKAFLLGHPKYRTLQVKEGTFNEAMELTGRAKGMFEMEDLLTRGRRLIEESVDAGVTHMRAFVEVDEIVGLKCLQAGVALKNEFQDACYVQLCAFAQLPLKPLDRGGDEIRRLMTESLRPEFEVEVVGSTPYVEADEESQKANIEWLIDLALKHETHIDYHLDYSVDPTSPTMVHQVLQTLKDRDWMSRSNKVITLGHCTRMLFYSDEELRKLKQDIGDLPVSFVGLPTSDLYMMRTDPSQRTDQTELRTTLNVPKLIKEYGINAAIGMNNIGNAFTPSGSCDPLFLASLGTSIYQTSTVEHARLLYECVSSRARAAIGFTNREIISFEAICKGDEANILLFPAATPGFETERNIEDKVYYYRQGGRKVISIPYNATRAHSLEYSNASSMLNDSDHEELMASLSRDTIMLAACNPAHTTSTTTTQNTSVSQNTTAYRNTPTSQNTSTSSMPMYGNHKQLQASLQRDTIVLAARDPNCTLPAADARSSTASDTTLPLGDDDEQLSNSLTRDTILLAARDPNRAATNIDSTNLLPASARSEITISSNSEGLNSARSADRTHSHHRLPTRTSNTRSSTTTSKPPHAGCSRGATASSGITPNTVPTTSTSAASHDADPSQTHTARVTITVIAEQDDAELVASLPVQTITLAARHPNTTTGPARHGGLGVTHLIAQAQAVLLRLHLTLPPPQPPANGEEPGQPNALPHPTTHLTPQGWLQAIGSRSPLCLRLVVAHLLAWRRGELVPPQLITYVFLSLREHGLLGLFAPFALLLPRSWHGENGGEAEVGLLVRRVVDTLHADRPLMPGELPRLAELLAAEQTASVRAAVRGMQRRQRLAAAGAAAGIAAPRRLLSPEEVVARLPPGVGHRVLAQRAVAGPRVFRTPRFGPRGGEARGIGGSAGEGAWAGAGASIDVDLAAALARVRRVEVDGEAEERRRVLERLRGVVGGYRW
ncbi:Hypothetical protein D9617_38g091140 [Elsinoe fawcettii]|nr:Hypothetical protein D9617_38g091140 [Elsinoe fawcettii]